MTYSCRKDEKDEYRCVGKNELKNHTCMVEVCENGKKVRSYLSQVTAFCDEYKDNECVETSCNNDGECVYEHASEWEDLLKREDRCYEAVCENKVGVLKKRANATEWESRSSGCVAYECVNESGGESKSKCGSSKVCVNDECVEMSSMSNDNDWLVIVEFHDGTYSGMKMIVDELSQLLGVDPSEVTLATELDEDGNVKRAYIVTEDEATAKLIAENMQLIATILVKTVDKLTGGRHIIWRSASRGIPDNAPVCRNRRHLLLSI